MTSPLQILGDARRERPGPARVARRPHGLSARKGRAAQAAQAEQRRLARADAKACLCHGVHSGPANGVRRLDSAGAIQSESSASAGHPACNVPRTSAGGQSPSRRDAPKRVRWNRLRQTGHTEVAPAGDVWHRRLAVFESEGGDDRADVFVYDAPPDHGPEPVTALEISTLQGGLLKFRPLSDDDRAAIHGAPLFVADAPSYIDKDLDDRWAAMNPPLTLSDMKRHIDAWLDGRGEDDREPVTPARSAASATARPASWPEPTERSEGGRGR